MTLRVVYRLKPHVTSGEIILLPAFTNSISFLTLKKGFVDTLTNRTYQKEQSRGLSGRASSHLGLLRIGY